MTTALVKFDEARRALKEATRIDEVKQIRDKAEALRLYARQQGESLEMQNACAEIKLRAERRAGELLAEIDRSNGGRPQKNSCHSGTSFKETVDEIGIAIRTAYRWEDIAKLPEDIFEREIAEVKDKGKELTSVYMLSVAKKLSRNGHDKNDEPVIITPQDANNCQLLTCDFATDDFDIAPNSIDFVITDPPYPREYIYLYEVLAKKAALLLKPGGSLLAMAGQSYLPEIFKMMTPYLNYQWTLTYLTPGGQSPQIWPRKVNTFWKPVLWFVKGEYTGPWVGDVLKSAVKIQNRTIKIDVTGPRSNGTFGNPGNGKRQTDFHLICEITGRDISWREVRPGTEYYQNIFPENGIWPERMIVWLNCLKHNLDYKMIKAALNSGKK